MIADCLRFLSENVTALCALAVVFSFGGIHGISLAWTQEHRFARWAARVADCYDVIAEAYDRGGEVGSDRGRRGPEGEAEPFGDHLDSPVVTTHEAVIQ